MADYGLTTSGFVIKELQTIRSELEAEYKETFGADIDVSETSVFGQIIANQAKKLHDMWELLQAVYASFSPDTAEGAQLDGAAALVAVARLPAASGTADVFLYASPGTIIPAGHLIMQTETEKLFSLDAAVRVDNSTILEEVKTLGEAQLEVNSVESSTAYQLTINGIAVTYTSDSSALEAEILAGLALAINATFPTTLTATATSTVLTIVSADGMSPFSLIVDTKMDIIILAGIGAYTALDTGAFAIPVGSLTTIVNPVSGLTTCTNINAGLQGRAVESDAELRVRRRRAVHSGSGTVDSIISALLQNVVGVTTVSVVTNRTDATVDGLPAHSVQINVSGGDDADVAQEIWNTIPVGIEMVGTTEVTLKDAAGYDQVVKFNRPTNVYIWVEIAISFYAEEEFPLDGLAAIRASVLEIAAAVQRAGIDVIRQRYFKAIYSVDGVGASTIKMAPSSSATIKPDAGEFVEADATIAANEIAVFDGSRIEVSVL